LQEGIDSIKSFDLTTATKELSDAVNHGTTLVDNFGGYLYILLIAVPGAIGSIFPGPGTAAGASVGQMIATALGAISAAFSGAALFAKAGASVVEAKRLVDEALAEDQPGIGGGLRQVALVALPPEKQADVDVFDSLPAPVQAAVIGAATLLGISSLIGGGIALGFALGQGGKKTTEGTAKKAGEQGAEAVTEKLAKRPGTRGHPDHQADVQGPGRAQAQAQARPGETVLTEQPIQGHPGINRRLDNQIVGTDGKTRLDVETERRFGPYHRKRVAEIEGAGIEVQIRPLPKKP
jgi:hypothetical protein